MLTLSRGRVVSEWDNATERAKPNSPHDNTNEVIPGWGQFIRRERNEFIDAAPRGLPTPFDPVTLTVEQPNEA